MSKRFVPPLIAALIAQPPPRATPQEKAAIQRRREEREHRRAEEIATTEWATIPAWQTMLINPSDKEPYPSWDKHAHRSLPNEATCTVVQITPILYWWNVEGYRITHMGTEHTATTAKEVALRYAFKLGYRPKKGGTE